MIMIRFFINGVKSTMKHQNRSLIGAIIEEFYMMFCVMGIELYIAYANGTASDYFELLTNKKKDVKHWRKSRQNDYYEGAIDFIEWLLTNKKYRSCIIVPNENCIRQEIGLSEDDIWEKSTSEIFNEFRNSK